MSTRQMRKLRRMLEMESSDSENVAKWLQNQGEEDEDEEDEVGLIPARRGLFGFAALPEDNGEGDCDGDDGDDEEEDDDEEDDDDDDSVRSESLAGSSNGAKVDATQDEKDENDAEARDEETVLARARSGKQATKKNKNKSNKKKKGKGKAKSKKKEEASGTTPHTQPGDVGTAEVDPAIQELRRLQAVVDDDVSKLLSIKQYHLQEVNELRRLFGRDVVEAARAEELAAAAAERIRRRRAGGPVTMNMEEFLGPRDGKNITDVVFRRNPFIEIKKTWPAGSTEGLSMKALTKEEGGLDLGPGAFEFTFTHDKNYEALEDIFFDLVQSYDPMQLVHFLPQHPYHVSTLIQVSRVAKQDGNMMLGTDLCERALFAFGRAALSSFCKKLALGRARLDFNRPESRQFCLAGFHYIQSLARKGSARTALEWAKLFLSTCPTDDYGMLHWIHVLAVRAREARWFVELCSSNWLTVCRVNSDYVKQTLILAHLQLGDMDIAKRLLIQGMETLPWLYCALYSTAEVATPKAVWGVQPRNEDEELHTRLYIHVAKELWTTSEAKELLQDTGNAAKKVDVDLLPTSLPVSPGTARFVYLDNTPALMSAVPRNMVYETPNFDFDPLPPPSSENVFSNLTQQRPWLHRPRGLLGGVSEAQIRSMIDQMQELMSRAAGRDQHVDELVAQLEAELVLRHAQGNMDDPEAWLGDSEDTSAEEDGGELPPLNSATGTWAQDDWLGGDDDTEGEDTDE